MHGRKIGPKMNYVEKYYRLNPEMFDDPGLVKLEESLESLTNDRARNVMSSFLVGAGYQLLTLAKKVNEADDETMEKPGKAFLKRDLLLRYTSTRIGSYPKVEEYLKKAMEEFSISKAPEEANKNEHLRILVLSIPYL